MFISFSFGLKRIGMVLLKGSKDFRLFTIQMESVLDSKKKSVESDLVNGTFNVLSL